MDSEMCEVSDDEYWRHIHYGPPVHESATEAENGEKSPLSGDAMVRCSELSPELRHTMLETNQVLRARIQRLERDWNEAEIQIDMHAMELLEDQ